MRSIALFLWKIGGRRRQALHLYAAMWCAGHEELYDANHPNVRHAMEELPRPYALPETLLPCALVPPCSAPHTTPSNSKVRLKGMPHIFKRPWEPILIKAFPRAYTTTCGHSKETCEITKRPVENRGELGYWLAMKRGAA